QIKAHKKNGKVLYWPEEVVVVSDECITEITPEVKTEYFYSFIERVNVVGHDFVFIQMKSHSGVIIPVRCFESGEQYSKFIDFIKTKSNNVDIIDC
ncbi:MAG: YcxB family protein, partial [Clostridia bacterium]|nr:YcxB family protein [Clostridia bacterium]